MSDFSPFSKGEMLSVFFTLCFFVSGSVSFACFCRSSLLRVAFEKIFGSELLLLGVGFVFWWVFAYGFAFFFWRFAPKGVWKNSLDVRAGVFGVVLLSFGFFRRSRFSGVFFFKRHRSGSNRTPPHAPFCLFLFSFCVPPRLFCPFWPCVPLLAFSSGCLSGPRAFLGFSWHLL